MKLVTFGALCVIAVLFAACAQHNRPCALKVACTLAVNWLLFSMPWIYPPASMAYLASYLDIHAAQADCWAALDTTCLIFTCWACWRVWWAPVIWSAYVVNLVMYVVADIHNLQYVDYASVLDAGLCVQLAVIYSAGAGGVQDRVSGSWLVRRLSGLQLLAVHLARGRRG